MTFRSWNPTASSSSFHRSEADAPESFDFGPLAAGERIGALLSVRRRKLMRRGLSLALLMGGVASWNVWGDQLTALRWPGVDVAAITNWLNASDGAVERQVTARSAVPEATAPEAVPQTAAVTAIVERPVASVALPVPAQKAEPEATPEAPPEQAAAPLEPLPQPTVDPSDKLQVRALSVGLHPGLSPVLLAKLSEADYRNAASAIRKALAETADDAVLIHPEQRKSDEAQFKVRFVPGAGGDCRRYVVAISKQGWLTTALPMEKCGVEAARSIARAARLAPRQPIEFNRRSP